MKTDDRDEFVYKAFISYSHKDKKWGNWLHKKLESYRVPSRLTTKAAESRRKPKRIYPVFKDEEELPAHSDLGANIKNALSKSETLIVICSPRAAQSHWVNEEVLEFKRLGREDRILALLVDGEPRASERLRPELEAFPEALRFKVDEQGRLTGVVVEPIAADVRRSGSGKTGAFLKIVAGILGVRYDELRERDKTTRRARRLRYATLATAVALVVTAVVSNLMQKNRALDPDLQRAAFLDYFYQKHITENLIYPDKRDARWIEKDKFDSRIDILFERDINGDRYLDYYVTSALPAYCGTAKWSCVRQIFVKEGDGYRIVFQSWENDVVYLLGEGKEGFRNIVTPIGQTGANEVLQTVFKYEPIKKKYVPTAVVYCSYGAVIPCQNEIVREDPASPYLTVFQPLSASLKDRYKREGPEVFEGFAAAYKGDKSRTIEPNWNEPLGINEDGLLLIQTGKTEFGVSRLSE